MIDVNRQVIIKNILATITRFRESVAGEVPDAFRPTPHVPLSTICERYPRPAGVAAAEARTALADYRAVVARWKTDVLEPLLALPQLFIAV